MPDFCAALGCSNERNAKTKQRGITFHRFPKAKEKRQAWAAALRRKNFEPNNYTSLCSCHFKPEDFDTTGQTTRLKEGAVPSVLTFPERPQKVLGKSRTRRRTQGAESVKEEKSEESKKPTVGRRRGRPKKRKPAKVDKEAAEVDTQPPQDAERASTTRRKNKSQKASETEAAEAAEGEEPQPNTEPAPAKRRTSRKELADFVEDEAQAQAQAQAQADGAAAAGSSKGRSKGSSRKVPADSAEDDAHQQRQAAAAALSWPPAAAAAASRLSRTSQRPAADSAALGLLLTDESGEASAISEMDHQYALDPVTVKKRLTEAQEKLEELRRDLRNSRDRERRHKRMVKSLLEELKKQKCANRGIVAEASTLFA